MDQSDVELVSIIKKENYWIRRFIQQFDAVEISRNEKQSLPESDHNLPRWLQELTPPPF